jgi:hypothetical protein
MEDLGFWYQLILNSKQVELITKNFSPGGGQITFSNFKPKDFVIVFIDIVKSTEHLGDNKKIEEIFEFLKEILNYFNSKVPEFLFKLVGDGVLILIPAEYKYDSNLNRLFNDLKQKTSLDFRIVGGLGTLYCIKFKTQNRTLEECIGCPISYLVKESKNVRYYKWFGEITPEECNEKHKQYSIWEF